MVLQNFLVHRLYFFHSYVKFSTTATSTAAWNLAHLEKIGKDSFTVRTERVDGEDGEFSQHCIVSAMHYHVSQLLHQPTTSSNNHKTCWLRFKMKFFKKQPFIDYCWCFSFDWSLRRWSGQGHRQRRQQSGQMDQGGDTYQEGARQVDEQRRGVLPTLPHLRHLVRPESGPNLSGERRLDRPLRRRLQSKTKRQQ